MNCDQMGPINLGNPQEFTVLEVSSMTCRSCVEFFRERWVLSSLFCSVLSSLFCWALSSVFCNDLYLCMSKRAAMPAVYIFLALPRFSSSAFSPIP